MHLAAHRADSLCYRIFDQPVGLEPLQILQSEQTQWRDWRVTYSILGASHAISLERGSDCFTELLTCLPPAIQSPALREFAVSDCRQDRVRLSDLEWDVRVWMCDWEETEDALLLLSRHTLQADFPAVYSPHTPRTRISLLPTPTYLQVYTLHTYPHEARSVHSRTVITPQGRQGEAKR
jgi:hypothetical protein